MVFCFESDLVSVLIIDDAQRSAGGGSRHTAGLALAVVTIVVGVLVLLSPCIKCLVLRRRGKPWRAALCEALRSGPSNESGARPARSCTQRAPRPHWSVRLVRMLHRHHAEPLPWPGSARPPPWAPTTAPDVVHLPPRAHVRFGSVAEGRTLDIEALPAYGDDVGRPPRYDEATQ